MENELKQIIVVDSNTQEVLVVIDMQGDSVYKKDGLFVDFNYDKSYTFQIDGLTNRMYIEEM